MNSPISAVSQRALLSRLMKPSRRFGFSSASGSPSVTTTTTTRVIYTFRDNQTPPEPQLTEIPIHSSPEPPVPVSVHLRPRSETAAAVAIQSAYRAHLIRTLVRKISAVSSAADHLQRQIQRQDTVDAIRSDDRERLKMNEALMALLLKLDSVPGLDPAVRELRRSVSRRIVGLQEILDSISNARTEGWDELLRSWDEAIDEMEEEICKERGGHEMERFCAENLGFRCLQRFLREP